MDLRFGQILINVRIVLTLWRNLSTYIWTPLVQPIFQPLVLEFPKSTC